MLNRNFRYALAALAFLVASPALAQSVSKGQVSTSAPVYVTGTAANLSLTTTGDLRTSATLATSAVIIGTVRIDQTTPGTTNNVTNVPTSASVVGITPVVSPSANDTLVLKASAGNLYSVYVTAGATAGFLMVFNATAEPADGAVTPLHCLNVPANTTVGIDYSGAVPAVFSTGITASFSTTGCFTKTTTPTVFFSGAVK